MAGKGKPGPLPGQRFGGRQKGTPNRITADLREMILGALDDNGGREYLAAQAVANPVAFMALLGKILPTQVNATVGNRDNRELTREELLAIASGGLSAGENEGERQLRSFPAPLRKLH